MDALHVDCLQTGESVDLRSPPIPLRPHLTAVEDLHVEFHHRSPVIGDQVGVSVADASASSFRHVCPCLLQTESNGQSVRRFGSDGSEEPFLGTTEQPVDQTLVRWFRPPNETIHTSIQTLDVELLTGLDLVLFPELGRQHYVVPWMKWWSSCRSKIVPFYARRRGRESFSHCVTFGTWYSGTDSRLATGPAGNTVRFRPLLRRPLLRRDPKPGSGYDLMDRAGQIVPPG